MFCTYSAAQLSCCCCPATLRRMRRRLMLKWPILRKREQAGFVLDTWAVALREHLAGEPGLIERLHLQAWESWRQLNPRRTTTTSKFLSATSSRPNTREQGTSLTYFGRGLLAKHSSSNQLSHLSTLHSRPPCGDWWWSPIVTNHAHHADTGH